MSKRLSFSIAVNLLTENFKKGANTVKNSFRSMQMQIVTFAAALGAGGLGLSGLITRLKDTARETNRVITALKNISGGTAQFGDNLKFLNTIADKYGLEVNGITESFAKFSAAATQANMPIEEQKKIFESLSRASSAFGLTADENKGVMLALSQMMGKGKISSEELRKQMGEKLPIAMQAMAKAAGTSMAGLEKLLKQGKLMSADILPGFADALNEIVKDVDTDNLEASLNRLSNAFGEFTNATGFQDKYKALIDGLTSLVKSAGENIKNIIIGIVAAIVFVVTNGLNKVYRAYAANGQQIIANERITSQKMRAAVEMYTKEKKRLSDLEVQHAKANAQRQVTIAKRIEDTKLQIQARAATARTAIAERVAAHENALQIKSAGRAGTIGAMFVGTAKKIGSALKSMVSMFGWGLLISGLTALSLYIKKAYDDTKWLEKATEDYNKDLAKEQINIDILFDKLKKATKGTEDYDKIKNEILSKYGGYLKGLSDEIKLLEDEAGAYKAISAAAIQAAKDKAITKNSEKAYDKYTSSFADNATELQKRLSDKFGKKEGTSIYDDIIKSLNEDKELPKEIQSVVDGFNKTYYGSSATGGGSSSHNPVGQLVNNIRVSKRRLNEEIEGIKTAFGEISDSATSDDPVVPIIPGTDPDENKDSLLKKKIEAEQWLINKRKELENENEKNQLEYEQKQIDLEDDGFDKRFKQIKLNHKKELLAIREFQVEKEKQQIEAAKKIYTSENGGKDEEFDFSKFDKSKLPAGLRPEDIETEVISRDIHSTKQQEKDTADLLRSMLDKYKDYNEQRKEINKQYNDDEVALTAIRNEENAKAIDAALEELRKSREKSIKEINDTEAKEFMKSTDLFVELFEDASRKSVSELKSIINKANELKKVFKDSSAEIPEWVVDSQMKDKDSLNPEQLKQAREAVRAYIEELKKDPKAIKDFEDAITSLYNTMGDTSPVSKFQNSINKAIEDIKKGGIENIGAGIQGIGDATQEIMPHLQKFSSDMRSIFGDGMGDSIDGFLKSVESLSEIGTGTGKILQGDLSGILDVASGFGKIFGHANKVNKEHREALRLLRLQAEEQKHLYKTDQLRERLASKSSSAVYGNNEWGKASDATKVYHDAVKELEQSLKKLEDVDVVTGSRKSGWGFWKKRKDVWGDLLSAYPKLIDGNGKFDKSLASTILSTQKLTDEGKMAIQQAIENAELVEDAFTQLKDYLSGTFGELGQNMLSAFADAFKGSKSALSDFVKSASGMLGKLVEDFIYNMRLAPIIEKASKEAENVMLNNKLTDEQKNQELVNITGNLIDNLLLQQNNVFSDLEKWGQSIKDKTGKNPFENETTQDSSKGYSASMDQDTGGAILGRVTGLHETGLRMEAFLKNISLDTSNYLSQSVSIANELKKQTDILNDSFQIHKKSYFKIESISEDMEVLGDVKDRLTQIEKNTKGLVSNK